MDTATYRTLHRRGDQILKLILIFLLNTTQCKTILMYLSKAFLSIVQSRKLPWQCEFGTSSYKESAAAKTAHNLPKY